MSARFVAAAWVALLIGGCAARPAPGPVVADVAYEREDWKYQQSVGAAIRSEHYELYTTLREPVLQQSLPQVLESAYNYYRELVPAAQPPAEPMKVYLFATRGEWEHFTRRLAGPRAATLLKVRGGGYSERGVSVIEYVAHEITFPVMLHEGFHQYLYHCVHPNIPAWLNEGLAVYCEGHRAGGHGVSGFDPWYNPTRRNALAELLVRDRELFSLEELLRINAGHVVGGTRRRIDAYYAQVWALMLFLREGEDGRYAPGFARLLAALGRDDIEPFARAAHATSSRPEYNFGQSLFSAFISDDYETVDREFRRFMRRTVLGEK